MAPKKTRSTSNAASETLASVLNNRGLTQSAAAAASGVTTAYVSNVMRGVSPASPKFLNNLSSGLGLNAVETLALHTAAARDHGFIVPEIDLTGYKHPEGEEK